MGAVTNGKISYCVRDQLPANIKVLHQKALVLMPTRTFPGIYGIELLWWHSVTNGLEEPHGVRAYDCTKKGEDFLLCTETTAKSKCYTKHLWFLCLQEHFLVHTVSNYYGSIP